MPAGTSQKQLLASPKVTEQRNLLSPGLSPWPWVQMEPLEHRGHGDSCRAPLCPTPDNHQHSLHVAAWEHCKTSIPHPFLSPSLEYLAVIFIDIFQAEGGLGAAPMPQWFLSSSLLQPEGRNWDQRWNKEWDQLRFTAGF